jgi:hypothetical protein
VTTDHAAENCLDCNPGAAHLGETATIPPGEWWPLDDHGTEIYAYGDQPVDIAYQVGAEAEIRRLSEALRLIGTRCHNYNGTWTCVDDPNRIPGGSSLTASWCEQCIVRTALDGKPLRAAVRQQP